MEEFMTERVVIGKEMELERREGSVNRGFREKKVLKAETYPGLLAGPIGGGGEEGRGVRGIGESDGATKRRRVGGR
jgi:hypothetical protein